MLLFYLYIFPNIDFGNPLLEVSFCSFSEGKPTFERHVSSCFQVHLAVSFVAYFPGIVANAIAAVLPAAQADALLEATGIGTLKREALFILVHEGVHEEVHRPLVFTFNNFTDC